MCGLIAAFSREGCSAVSAQGLQAALERMRNRGPDGEGTWVYEGVALGHRRLAILDLDGRAAQPMISACGRYVIVFNGEIYNFRELRKTLEAKGTQFCTASDTEVLLALFAEKGEAMLRHLEGMFAFVIWDRMEKKAFAARDPYGIKPLYIANTPNGIILASQVKALQATGSISRELSPEGVIRFWLLGSVPEPYTWYRDISALPAGQAAWIQDGKVIRQWTWRDIGDAWRQAPVPARHDSVGLLVRDAVRESVQRHLVSDVPVGVFLSGGIDSGALAGLMAEAGVRNLVGVTVTYDEFAGRPEDEAPAAALIARHFGIHHVTRKITREEFVADLPRILDAMDQPSIDGVNTWYAAKAVAEQGLKVIVSGVGGDELFQGYSHFREIPRLLRLRQATGAIPFSNGIWRMIGKIQAARTGKARWNHLADWTQSSAGLWWLRRSVRAPEELQALLPPSVLEHHRGRIDADRLVHDMTGDLPSDPTLAVGQIESMTYLRNQLLRDSDWASMDHGIELRTPLVDARLLSALTPVLGGLGVPGGKGLLAQTPKAGLPPQILQRTKTGFGIPIEKWLTAGQSSSSPLAWQLSVASEYGKT